MSILNINGGGSGAYIRFMPSVNAWIYKDEELALKHFLFDHDSIKTGWGKMSEGQAPDWSWDPQLGVAQAQPSSEHKRGFSIKMWSKATGTVEWSSTGTGPVMGFDVIFEEIYDAAKANAGKVPVVEYTGSDALKVGKGNTRRPNFKLVKWVDRASIKWDAEAGAAPAAAPKPAPKPEPVDDDIEF